MQRYEKLFLRKKCLECFTTINEKIPVPKDSIEIKCFIDPGQSSGIDQDDVINNYTILKDYIGNYNHNDFSSEEYSDYAFTGKGMILEDNKYLYMISYDEDDDFINWEFSQYDKKSQEVKTQYDVLGTRLAGYVYYNISDDEYVISLYWKFRYYILIKVSISKIMGMLPVQHSTPKLTRNFSVL